MLGFAAASTDMLAFAIPASRTDNGSGTIPVTSHYCLLPDSKAKGYDMATERFPWGRTFVLGSGFLGISIVWRLFNSLIPPMLEDLGLSAVRVGFIMTWDNTINMFVEPWVGARSDRTRTRLGRRKPWLLAGAPLAALFFILVPFVRQNFVLIALGILSTDVCMALFRSPTIAYLGDLFQPAQRSKANGVINLMGGVGGAIAFLGGGALYRLGVPLPFIFGAGAMLVAILIVVWRVQECEQDPVAAANEPGLLRSLQMAAAGRRRSGLCLLGAIYAWFVGWEAMEAFFTTYARDTLGISVGRATQMPTAFVVPLIVFSIPSGLIATRIGRKATIMMGLCGMVLGLVAGYLVRNPVALLGVLAVMGACWALININSLPMVYDLCHESSIGAYTGLYYFASSLAAITGPIVAGRLIDVTSHAVIWPLAAVFMLLALVLMSLVQTYR